MSDKLKSEGYVENELYNNQIFDHLKTEIDKDKFLSWISELKILTSQDKNIVKVCAKSPFICKWISNNYIDLIYDAVHTTIGQQYNVDVINDEI